MQLTINAIHSHYLDAPAVTDDRCPDPGTPSNARRQISDQLFRRGATIDFMCDNGYILQGNTTMTCIGRNQWDSQLPTCIADTCV